MRAVTQRKNYVEGGVYVLKNSKILKIMILAIAFILILSYAFSAYLPHAHKCPETECTVCKLIDSAAKIMLGILLLLIAWLVPIIEFLLPTLHECTALGSAKTPVGLKVKLSN